MSLINNLSLLQTLSGINLFNTQSGSASTATGGILRVEQVFNGTNYLEMLAKVNSVDDLVSAMSTDEENLNAGSIHSADADSIFNKFSIFKYSKFINGAVYQPQAHFIGYESGRSQDPNNTTLNLNTADRQNLEANIGLATNKLASNPNDPNRAQIQSFANNNQQLMELRRKRAENYNVINTSSIANPTAKNIIEWGKTQSMESVTGFQPYAMSDFLFCKKYGKIPNNRMITLRRYPFPIDDILRVPGEKNPIPIAQAITWFGEGTDNLLSNIGVMNWGLRWDSTSLRIDNYQEVEGNEVTLDDLLGVFEKIPALKGLSEKVRTIYVGLMGKDAQVTQISGMEKKLQDYSRNLYTANGPYWHRIYGPVNVVNATTRRARGMQDGWNQPFALNFHYAFRSFSGLSPKIVALDLIAHFLNLTYNDAQFLGQLYRYFPRLGVKFSPSTTQILGDLLTKWGTSFSAGSSTEIAKLTQIIMEGINQIGSQGMGIIQGIFDGDISKLDETGRRLLQAGSASLLAGAMPNLISAKSALSDRPIGEWHIVVGNPMNPIMVMGDLVVTNCILKFDEEMGPDDFPTGCTFTVKLAQGKPRDKAAIERMFNLGEAKLMYNRMKNPSSASDTHGTKNNTDVAAISQEPTAKQKKAMENDPQFKAYRGRIRRAYGYNYDGNTNASAAGAIKMDDSLLWLYFDRAQDKT